MNKYLSKSLNVVWLLIKYGLILITASLILILILLGTVHKNLSQATSNGLYGKKNMDRAILNIKQQDFISAFNYAQKAKYNFNIALNNLEEIKANIAVKNIGLLERQVNDLEYLLKTSKIVSQSLIRVLPIINNLQKIQKESGQQNFSGWPNNNKAKFIQLIYESQPELNGLQASLKLALLNFNRINKIGILWPVYNKLNKLREDLESAVNLIQKISPIVKLLPVLTGHPNTNNFLLILQNNDELRPSGGFIGAYAILKVNNGNIVSLISNDSYHLDAPASVSEQWTMLPPASLKKYLRVKKWYLRDANWSPNWPTSAQKINEIFQGESKAIKQAKPKFTGIIAITPDLVAKLIKLVGPLKVKGDIYKADNFQTLLQYNVEVAYKDRNISSWDRKNIINNLISQLKDKLLSLKINKWEELFEIFNESTSSKSIQIYFFNTNWENLVRELGASGEIKNSNNDYLFVVNSNLGAFKSDVVIKKDIDYTINKEKDKLQANLNLNYSHEGKRDWRTTRYRSYTRIYVPLNSHLISINDSNKSLDNFSVKDDKVLNKTIFSFFFTVEPGHQEKIELKYNLPKQIEEQLSNNTYQLLVQKQAGQKTNKLKINIKNEDQVLKVWSSKLGTDQVFKLQ